MDTNTPGGPSTATPVPTPSGAPTSGRPARPPEPVLFCDPDFQAAGRSALGRSAQGIVDLGLTLLTLSRIADGDPGSWYQQWHAMADDQRSRAEQARACGHLDRGRPLPRGLGRVLPGTGLRRRHARRRRARTHVPSRS